MNEENINKPLSLELLDAIHQDVFPEQDHLMFSNDFGLTDDSNLAFSTRERLVDSDSHLQQVSQEIQNLVGTNKKAFTVTQDAIITNWTKKEVNEYLPRIFEHYNATIINMQTSDDKIQLIVKV